MTTLRVDPWESERGSSNEVDAELPLPHVELDVEGAAWEACRPAVAAPPCCAFVDGVRRVDVRLYAEEPTEIAPALAGSWAVGAAWSTRPPAIDEVTVGRCLIIGGGLTHAELCGRVGNDELVYVPSSVSGSTPIDPLQGLQNAMRQAEAELAERIVHSHRAELLVLDGPLTYFSQAGAVVGLIKRQQRAYLPTDRAHLLTTILPGERTPLFGLGQQRLERYSWYQRLAVGRRIDGALTGIIRLEVTAIAGVEQAARIADVCATVLPRFASVVGRDPRAPQNLYPVGQLEAVLRHRLGDALLVRRAIEARLWETYAATT